VAICSCRRTEGLPAPPLLFLNSSFHTKRVVMEVVLKRTYYPGGTNGELFLFGIRVCYTIELPWKDNRRRISCIPEGKYELQKRYTQRFGHHFLLLNVPGRDYILLHAANDAMKEMFGCIAPVSALTGEGKGSQSRIALGKLVKLLYPEMEKGKVWIVVEAGVVSGALRRAQGDR